MTHPLLYEVNTRIWLRELSEREGRSVTLADVPESEIQRWQSLGFSHVWLMGVWQVGERAREAAVQHWRDDWRKQIASTEHDVHGSPFAIREYDVDARLGKTIDLLLLKERFARAGLSLILDFVPNHLGVDSPEPIRYPARFVQAPSAVPGTFDLKTKFGKRHFAHGRDPFFPPWTDTIQLDYRVAETQQSMAAVAQTISMFGHGLRCDMAMLLLPEIFEETWREFPCQGAHQTMQNFWRAAIPAIRQLQPQVDLIAEAYWDREQELQDLGFDYTYNKKVTDLIARGEFTELKEFLVNASPHFLRRCVHFLENHDEPRVASTLPLERHKAAALLILGLPGMALLHDGQLEGRTQFARIQIARRNEEAPNREIASYYDALLKAVGLTAVRRGKAEVLPTKSDLIAIRWVSKPGQADLVLVNLTDAEVTLGFSLPEPAEVLLATIPLQAVNASLAAGALAPSSGAIVRVPHS